MSPEEFKQHQLNIFYGVRWLTRDTDLDQYRYSGYILGEKILPGEKVIHINCDTNPFKGMVSNLVGIDPFSDVADKKMTVDQFLYTHIAEKFNVAFCLGGINLGTQADIQIQIASMIKTLRQRDARIYWRCYTIPPDDVTNFFVWSAELLFQFSTMFDFEIIELEEDTNGTLYCEWWSNNRSSTLGPT